GVERACGPPKAGTDPAGPPRRRLVARQRSRRPVTSGVARLADRPGGPGARRRPERHARGAPRRRRHALLLRPPAKARPVRRLPRRMSAHSPDVSVVVATRDREPRLAGLLRALGEQRLDPERFEVIVVDDRSADGTAELLERTARTAPFQLTSDSLERGSGPAAARNAGWTRARGPLVAFTDDDCEPHPDWLREAVDAAGRRRDSVVGGPTHPLPRA